MSKNSEGQKLFQQAGSSMEMLEQSNYSAFYKKTFRKAKSGAGEARSMNFDKTAVDIIMEKFHIQPVGNGYIDMICPMQNVGEFIDCMEESGITIKGFTWWCHVQNDHQPCGLGGPRNRYGDGWFSEIPMNKVICFESNEKLKHYLLVDYPDSHEYKECYVPAFWLDTP